VRGEQEALQAALQSPKQDAPLHLINRKKSIHENREKSFLLNSSPKSCGPLVKMVHQYHNTQQRYDTFFSDSDPVPHSYCTHVHPPWKRENNQNRTNTSCFLTHYRTLLDIQT